MKNLKLILTVGLLSTLVGCVNGDDYNTPDLSGECVDIAATKSVQDIAVLANSTAQQYTNDDFIEAYVTSSDEGGNFYKSISLVSLDGTKGFTMPVDAYNLYTKFEPGRKVTINMKNRHFHNNTQIASLEIGSLYNNDTPDIPGDDRVGRISGVEYENIINRSCTKVDEETIVRRMTIAQAKNNQYTNMLIEFDAVQFTDGSVGGKYYDDNYPALNFSSPTYPSNIGGATNHEIVDRSGSKIFLRVSEFATFSGNQIPALSGKIRGVLTKYNNDFQFMVRTINDVKLTDPRIVPLFEETFTSNWNDWTKFSVSGAQVWTLNTTFGNPGSCALMSGFSGGVNNVNEDWLISPAINLSSVSTATLTFDNASRFAGNLLEVYVSTNYNSGAPNTATWTQITGFTLDTNTGSYIWTNSGGINISSYTGSSNFRVAFRYTSTASASRTWEIDNVKVQ